MDHERAPETTADRSSGVGDLVARAHAYLASNAAESGADALIAEMVDTIERAAKHIDELQAKVTCMCGDNIDHSPWCGHSPVSMFDYAVLKEVEQRHADMLAALNATADELEDADPSRRAAIQFARETIAKAEGRS